MALSAVSTQDEHAMTSEHSSRGEGGGNATVVATGVLEQWLPHGTLRLLFDQKVTLLAAEGATLLDARGSSATSLTLKLSADGAAYQGRALLLTLLPADNTLRFAAKALPIETWCDPPPTRRCAAASLSLLDDWGNGGKVEVLLSTWRPGALVEVSFRSGGGVAAGSEGGEGGEGEGGNGKGGNGDGGDAEGAKLSVEVTSGWQATVLRSSGGLLLFQLGSGPGPQGGFGFSARGYLLGADVTIRCSWDGPAPLASPSLAGAAIPPHGPVSAPRLKGKPVASGAECGSFNLMWGDTVGGDSAEEYALFYTREVEGASQGVMGDQQVIRPLASGVIGTSFQVVGLPTLDTAHRQLVYRFAVRAKAAGGWGVLSALSRAMSSAALRPPGAPSGLHLQLRGGGPLSCANLQLAWLPDLGCEIHEYAVSAAAISTGAPLVWVPLESDKLASRTFSRFAGAPCEGASRLALRIRARNAAGWGNCNTPLGSHSDPQHPYMHIHRSSVDHPHRSPRAVHHHLSIYYSITHTPSDPCVP